MRRISQNRRGAAIKAASIIAVLLFLCALTAMTPNAQTVYAGTPDCPSSWPADQGEQFFTDPDGAEWFVIRSADSNGYETLRAYPADDGYATGYVPGSPDEICNLIVRRPRSLAGNPG